MRVGFIGAGRMGTPMIGRLVAGGHDVRALGRTSEKRTAVAQLGASATAEAWQAIEDAEVVVLCVFTDEQLRSLCLPGAAGPGLIADLPMGSVLVVHTTGSPSTVQMLAEAAAGRDVEVVDAPVSGGPDDIAAGHVTLFVGGSDDAVSRARLVLGCYGDPVLHIGPIGCGQKVKLVNNALFAAQIGLTVEAVRVAAQLGLAEPAVLAALRFGSAGSRAMDSIANAGSTAAFIGAVREFIGKDIAVVRRTAAALGTDLGQLDAIVDAGLAI